METIPIKDILSWILPAFLTAMAALIALAIRSFSLSKTVRKYQDDIYRQSIESKIVDLEKQLVVSRDRFESVNHLLLEGQKAAKNLSNEKINRDDFLQSLNVDINVKVNEDLVFVIMPFNKDFLYTYSVIKESVEDIGLVCKRGDEEKRSAAILPHIIQEMVKAKIIIADITGRNPNVFYELGIAHTLNKPVLMISQSIADIPFDVVTTRILVYKSASDLKADLKKWLVGSVRAYN